MSAPRTIAIGDIHGCDVALETLLGVLDVQAEDVVVVLGDVIDRGPNTRRCVELLLGLKQRCRMVCLMGNHEEMMLDAMYGGHWSGTWFSYGGEQMLVSYGGGFTDVPPRHLDFLRNGKDFFETDTHIFVHANLRPYVPPDQEQAHWLRWARFEPDQPPHESGKTVICGHTAQPDGRPVVIRGWICLDTCAYCPEGALSALHVETSLLWQATQAGELRGPFDLGDFI